MGIVHGNWLTGTHSGRACRHENVYTRVNKKTGQCYSAQLCPPPIATCLLFLGKDSEARSDEALQTLQTLHILE